MRKTLLIFGGLGMLLLASACATANAIATLEDRFQAIGISPDMAKCMVGELREDLDDDDIKDLADYTTRISKASSTAAAIEELVRIDNTRAVAAIGKAGFSCKTGFGL